METWQVLCFLSCAQWVGLASDYSHGAPCLVKRDSEGNPIGQIPAKPPASHYRKYGVFLNTSSLDTNSRQFIQAKVISCYRLVWLLFHPFSCPPKQY